MGRPSVARVEAGFDFVLALRHIERHWADYRTPEFWRGLNPHLTVSASPLATARPHPAIVSDDAAASAAVQLDRDGYLATSPVVTDARMAPIRQAMDTLAARGIPAGFVAVYDEYYALFEGLEPLFAPILGERYLWVAHGFWAFRVPPGDQAINSLWAPASPHRDSLGPDPRILAGERPGIMTVWIALTDVTPADSCIYVVPAAADRAFRTAERDVHPGQFELQDIRAVPAQAGSVLAWSTHLAHWGSRGSAASTRTRMSATMYFQRADVPAFDASVFDPSGPVPLDDRLRWVIGALGAHDLIPRLDWGNDR